MSDTNPAATGRNLIICAFWVEGVEPDDATRALSVASVPGRIKGSGAVVSIAAANVDALLRCWLRNVNIEEAANVR